MSKAKTVKKVLTIIGNVLLYCFIAVALFAVIVSISAKKDPDGTATVFGYQMRRVITGSMEKCDQTDVSKYKIKDIPLNAVVFIETVPENEADAQKWYGNLKKGDVLTFKFSDNQGSPANNMKVITHRIIEDPVYLESAGGYTIKLQGDNRDSEEGVMTQIIHTHMIGNSAYYNSVIGKVVNVNYPIGLLLFSLENPIGLICIVILPCLIIIVFEVIKIVRVFGREKKEKDQVEKEKQQSEIEELRRQLELLKNGGAPAPPETPPSADASGSENTNETANETLALETSENSASNGLGSSDNSGEATTETTENP
ncbi:MAG: hypothetical protein IJB97_01050 [Clostridia bacterium]|nr:hypothetical protein [Clostridia bacterium]